MKTQRLPETPRQECLLLKSNLTKETFCRRIVNGTLHQHNVLNIFLHNAVLHYPAESLEESSSKQLNLTFRANIYPLFYTVQEASAILKKEDCVINTSSVTAYRDSDHLTDYCNTKGESSLLPARWHNSLLQRRSV